MLIHLQRNRQSADWAEVPLWPLVSLAVQLLVFQLRRAFLAGALVPLAVGLLAVDAAIFDEVTGRAVLELDRATLASTAFSAVGAHAS